MKGNREGVSIIVEINNVDISKSKSGSRWEGSNVSNRNEIGYLLVTSVVGGIRLRHYSDKINHLGDLVMIETKKKLTRASGPTI